MNLLMLLVRSRKFWLAVFGLVQTVVFALIAAIAVEDAAEKVGRGRAVR